MQWQELRAGPADLARQSSSRMRREPGRVFVFACGGECVTGSRPGPDHELDSLLQHMPLLEMLDQDRPVRRQGSHLLPVLLHGPTGTEDLPGGRHQAPPIPLNPIDLWTFFVSSVVVFGLVFGFFISFGNLRLPDLLHLTKSFCWFIEWIALYPSSP